MLINVTYNNFNWIDFFVCNNPASTLGRYIGYYAGTYYVTWYFAVQHCQQSYESEIASIHNNEQNNIAALSTNGNGAWIGLSDEISENSFIWNDGTPYDYSNWIGGNPDNYANNEDCTMTNWNGFGAWNDANCAAGLKLRIFFMFLFYCFKFSCVFSFF